MPTLTIDGKEITVEPGTSVFEAARQANIPIPHFCYHPKLTVAGNCRMCLVDIEKMPKPAISCNTVATDGMVVHTQNQKVKDLQKNVLEFILINHPIDCPVCDQAGECRLQNYYMDHDLSDSNFEEEKVHKPKRVDLGPNVMLDDERCILCSRCIRFCDEISKTGELAFINRGDRSTLTTFPGKKLDNAYSLNTVDICPVGALTSKPFRFKKRVWFLRSVPSICTGCSTGCNIFIDHHDGKVWRYKTRENEAVNQCWTCDEGRLSYTAINDHRVTRPLIRQADQLDFASVSQSLQLLKEVLQGVEASQIVFIGSAQESNENNFALKKLAQAFGANQVFYTAKEVENPTHDDFLIKADKNPNRAGVEFLGFTPFSESVRDKVVIVLDSLPIPILEKMRSEAPRFLILLAANEGAALELAHLILPAASFAEQDGSFTNFQKRLQRFRSALIPHGEIKPAWRWCEEIAKAAGKSLALGSPEQLFSEAFRLKYADLEPAGKVIESA